MELHHFSVLLVCIQVFFFFAFLESYMQHCFILDSFAQGVSLSGISDFKIENNTFYNIMGHGIKIRK